MKETVRGIVEIENLVMTKEIQIDIGIKVDQNRTINIGNPIRVMIEIEAAVRREETIAMIEIHQEDRTVKSIIGAVQIDNLIASLQRSVKT